jgi:hypothetical protein
MRTIQKQLLFALATILGMIAVPVQQYDAQELSQIKAPLLQDPKTGRKYVQKFIRRTDEYDTKPFSGAVALPGLPQYTGKGVFVCGGYMPNVSGGSTSYLRYRAFEEPTTVLNWYREVLKMNKWSLDASATRSDAIAAILPGSGTCHIQTVPVVVEGGYKCEFLIEYKQVRLPAVNE